MLPVPRSLPSSTDIGGQSFVIKNIGSSLIVAPNEFPLNPLRRSVKVFIEDIVREFLAEWPRYLRPVPNIDLWDSLHRKGLFGNGLHSQLSSVSINLRDILALGMMYIDAEDGPSRAPTSEFSDLPDYVISIIMKVYQHYSGTRIANNYNNFFFPVMVTIRVAELGENGTGEKINSYCLFTAYSNEKENNYWINCTLGKCHLFRALQEEFRNMLRDGACKLNGFLPRVYNVFIRYNEQYWITIKCIIEDIPTVKVTILIYDPRKTIDQPICPRVSHYLKSLGTHIHLIEVAAGLKISEYSQKEWANKKGIECQEPVLKAEVQIFRAPHCLRRVDNYSGGHCALGQMMAMIDGWECEEKLQQKVRFLQVQGVNYLAKIMLSDLFCGFVYRKTLCE